MILLFYLGNLTVFLRENTALLLKTSDLLALKKAVDVKICRRPGQKVVAVKLGQVQVKKVVAVKIRLCPNILKIM